MAKKFEIQHDRQNCIGCSACVAISQKFWKMSDDGKSEIIGETRDEKGLSHLDIDEADLQENKDAAGSCPVSAIHIINKATKEKVV